MSDGQLKLFDDPGTATTGELRENGPENAPQGKPQGEEKTTTGGCRTR